VSVKLVSLIDQLVALISFCRLEIIKVFSRLIKTIIRMAATINVKYKQAKQIEHVRGRT
jgi:hypothetical protein